MNEYTIHRDEDSLSHYGVPGTKWGVRRYQNKDGSYKPGAEGRYYQAVPDSVRKIAINAATKTAAKAAGAKIAATKIVGAITGNKSVQGGGGGTAAKKEAQPINKTVLGKDIDVKDASQKLDTSSSKEKKSSTKKAKDESAGNEEFKLSQLEDKINNLFDMDDMTDKDWEDMDLHQSDIDEIDDLITKYRAWRKGNKSNTKKLKKIDEFIERYESWKSSHSKHSEMRELYLMHHGILGMHWGIRRYQNKDGSLTAEGKARYRKAFDDYYKAERKANESKKNSDFKSAKKIGDNLVNNIRKDTRYSEKINQIFSEAQNKFIEFDKTNPSASQIFNTLANRSIESYEFMMEAAKGSYEQFLKQIDYEGRGNYSENAESIKANDPILQEVYKYGKMQNEINEQLRKDLSALNDVTVSSLGFDPNSEEGERIKRFITMNLF